MINQPAIGFKLNLKKVKLTKISIPTETEVVINFAKPLPVR